MPAANTFAAAGLTASAKIFGKKDTAGARWIAGDFTKYAPAETLIELRCLEVVRSQDDLTTGARQGVLLDRPHQPRAVTLVAQLGRSEKILKIAGIAPAPATGTADDGAEN